MALDDSTPRSRRALIVGALGGVAAFAALAMGRPSLTEATHAGYVQIGHNNPELNPTEISNQANPNDVFLARSSSGTAVMGQSQTGIAVYGFSNTAAGGRFQGNPGVAGLGGSGYGGFFSGGAAQLRLLPKSTAGKPRTGSHLKGEVYMDLNGTIFICTSGGTPGTWKRVQTKLA